MADIMLGQLLHRPTIDPISGDSPLPVQLSGFLLERYGATEAQRPAANSVPIGTVYMAVQTQQMWQSDGSQWVVM
jgi:hypothetical protein